MRKIQVFSHFVKRCGLNKIILGLVNEVVQIEVSGKKLINGTVIDLGSDMIVLFNGTDFVYIPLNHIQSFKVDCDNENEIKDPTEPPSIITEENEGGFIFWRGTHTSER